MIIPHFKDVLKFDWTAIPRSSSPSKPEAEYFHRQPINICFSLRTGFPNLFRRHYLSDRPQNYYLSSLSSDKHLFWLIFLSPPHCPPVQPQLANTYACLITPQTWYNHCLNNCQTFWHLFLGYSEITGTGEYQLRKWPLIDFLQLNWRKSPVRHTLYSLQWTSVHKPTFPGQ